MTNGKLQHAMEYLGTFWFVDLLTYLLVVDLLTLKIRISIIQSLFFISINSKNNATNMQREIISYVRLRKI